jgi:hypothetical protein
LGQNDPLKLKIGTNGNRGETTQGANGIRGETTRIRVFWSKQ